MSRHGGDKTHFVCVCVCVCVCVYIQGHEAEVATLNKMRPAPKKTDWVKLAKSKA